MQSTHVRWRGSRAPLALAAALALAACSEPVSTGFGPEVETAADRTLAPGQLSFYGLGGLQRSHPLTPCVGDGPYRDFDFWVGEFTVTGPAGGLAGTNRILSTLDGCLVEENWTGAGGGQGRSMNVYDAATGEWSQYWFDQFGTHLRLFGGLDNGVMQLAGDRLFQGQLPIVDRIRWTPMDAGVVNQFWDISVDGGQTFPFVAFNGTYTPDPNVTPAPPLGQQFCTNPEYRHLDFLEGTWAVRAENGLDLGTSVVNVDLEGCMVEEDFSAPSGYASQSFSGWDFTNGTWYRVFMDTEGIKLLLSGGIEGSAMVLTGTRPSAGNQTLHVRLTIQPDGADRVVQTWATSRDGAAWKDTQTVVLTR